MKKSLHIEVTVDAENYMDVALIEEKLNEAGVKYAMSVMDDTGNANNNTRIIRRRPDGTRRRTIPFDKAKLIFDESRNINTKSENLSKKHNVSRASVERIRSGIWFEKYYNKRGTPVPVMFTLN